MYLTYLSEIIAFLRKQVFRLIATAERPYRTYSSKIRSAAVVWYRFGGNSISAKLTYTIS